MFVIQPKNSNCFEILFVPSKPFVVHVLLWNDVVGVTVLEKVHIYME